MITLGKTIISDEIAEKQFVCNLSACKGICCVEGASGAPLEKEEKTFLENNIDKINPFLSEEGQKAINEQGVSVIDSDGDLVTPLVEGKECAYVVFDETGTSKCGIERAYEQGAINFIKPISCHLYPIRIHEYKKFTAVNYHYWEICNSACEMGKQLSIPVYRFLKQALIRKFGEQWYQSLENTIENSSQKRN